MTCAACQSHVEHALKETPGVSEASVNLMTNSARVIFDPEIARPESLVEAVHNAGYEATLPAPTNESTGGHDHDSENETALKAKALGTLVGGGGGNVAVHATDGHALTPRSAADAACPALYSGSSQTLRLSLLVLTIAGMIWAGSAIYARAWKALLHRGTNMNTLVALGTGAAFIYSAAATFFPQAFLRHGLLPDVYYESVLLILGFLLTGNWLDARAKRRTVDASRSFAALQPQEVALLREGVEVRVPLASVMPGDMVVVRPGERLHRRWRRLPQGVAP